MYSQAQRWSYAAPPTRRALALPAPLRARLVSVEPRIPLLTAHNASEEPWRLALLARVDGRVRELTRILTRDPASGVSSLGEVVWAHHVTQLQDDRGTLVAHISSQLAGDAWLGVVAAVLARAWDGEDERKVAFRLPDRRLLSLEEVLPALTTDG